MKAHDAAINLVEACEALRMAREITGSSEVTRLIDIASVRIKATGDGLYPDIIREMKEQKYDSML